MKGSLCLLLLGLALLSPPGAWAAHPLITDDTGTQGRGKYQLELNGHYATDEKREAGAIVRSTAWELGVSAAAGLADTVDVIVGLPYAGYEIEESGATTAHETGLADVVAEVKWRFFEQDGMSFAVKPGITLPTGDEDKGLGPGEAGGHVNLIATWVTEPFAFHANLGYIRNENRAGEEVDLWHVSVAAEYSVAAMTRIAANIGVEKNRDPAADVAPAFALLGVIYSPSEDFDLDAGIKAGLNRPEDDLVFLTGVTLRF